MRDNEVNEVKGFFENEFDLKLNVIDAKRSFYEKLFGISDPETKRKIIGKLFIEIFEEEASKYPNAKWLAQGTLKTDVIESMSIDVKTVAVKSHHNVGGLPEKMNLKLLEPFRELYKEDVRELGRNLGLPSKIVYRHPFPGPGLAIRILGEITEERVRLLQKVDEIFISALYRENLYYNVWQAFAVLLPIQSVGIREGKRSYEYVCSLRAVESKDGITAQPVELPFSFLTNVSNEIIDSVIGVNRIVYDISSKPPATIEWE
jgi:GMP synthase (glutamine-hydrolysing)